VEFIRRRKMRKRRSRKSEIVKMIFADKNQILPKGYVPIAGFLFDGIEIQAAIPEKYILEHPELANKLATEASEKFSELLLDRDL
jgi:hypothetical protein